MLSTIYNINRIEKYNKANEVFNEDINFFVDYEDMAVLINRIPENEIVKDYEIKFLKDEEGIYKSDAVVRTMNEDDCVLSNYLKSTSAILKFIDHTIAVENKETYIEFFASQLSDQEFTVLFCYSHILINREIQEYFNKYKILRSAKYADGDILSNQLLNYASVDR